MEYAAIIAAATSLAGAAGSAANKANAEIERTRNHNRLVDFMTSEYFRDPLSTVGNRSLIKSAKKTYKDNMDAIDNRMVAGGATIENQLAARKTNNEGLSRLYGSLLQGDDSRRDAIKQQRLQLEQNYSAGVQQGYLQSAQDWQAWGAQMAQAGMQLGSSGLFDKKSATQEEQQVYEA